MDSIMARRGLSVAAGIVLVPLAGGLLQGALPPIADLIAPAFYGTSRVGGVPRLLLGLGLKQAPRAAD
jgi:hypothetical protein